MFPIRDHNPSQGTPIVTILLIAVNIGVFVMALLLFQTERDVAKFFTHYGMVPADLAAGDNFGALFSSMFLHGGLLHLAGNMLFLWIFGDNMEDEMGHVGFLLFYLACGVGAAAAQFLAAPYSTVPMVGASGAIAGVMGGYLLFFPRARVDVIVFFLIFFRIIPIPAWLVLGIWFGVQFISGAGTADIAGGGVAYWAHAGGFALGVILALPLWLRRGGARYWRHTRGKPPHPEAKYERIRTRIPPVPRGRSGRSRW